MPTTQVLQWEMYGRGTAVAFSAYREESGFEIVLRRDDELLVTTRVAESQALLKQSSDLREYLQRLGFAPKPSEPRASHLTGGVCWGPAAPLQSSIVSALG